MQRALTLGGTWELQGTRIASTTQTRFVLGNAEAGEFPANAPQVFYRVLVLP